MGDTVIGHGVPGLNIKQAFDFPVPCTAVFAALTDGIDLWWPATMRVTGTGARLRLAPVLGAALVEEGPGRAGVIWGQIDAMTVPSRLYLNGWFGIPGVVMGRVHFDLTETLEGCRLSLLHQAIGPVPEDVAARHRQRWREVLDGALRSYLAGTPV